MADPELWDQRYRHGPTPWDTNFPSSELAKVIAEAKISPCRALELGCGSGTNALWLAMEGFDVTALDISSTAIERAQERAQSAGAKVRFLVADLLNPPELHENFGFFFDRGCYHVIRRENAAAYWAFLRKVIAYRGQGLVLAGNAKEPKKEPGPPVVTENELRADWSNGFEIIQLREFRFDSIPGSGESFLGWSCLLRRSEGFDRRL